MIRKKIKNLGNKILILEKECQLGLNIEKNTQEMAQLISDLSFEEILQLNMYIEEKMLTK